MRKLTQEALAALVEVDPESISRFERGTVVPSLATLESISIALNVGLADIFDRVSLNQGAMTERLSRAMEGLQEADQVLLLDFLDNLAARLKAHTAKTS